MQELPRIALLFITRGPMPLESVWRTVLEEAAKYRLMPLRAEDWEAVLEHQRVQQLEAKLREAGVYEPNDVMRRQCVRNDDIRVRAN